MDLRYVVRSLPLGGDTTLPDFEGLCVLDVGDFLKKIMGLMAVHMQSLIDNSPKLYLLYGRLESNEKGGLTQRSLHFRHYLKAANIHHRVSLTRLFLSHHPLALEQLRYPEHCQPQVQRSFRLCGFCHERIESPEHAFFECTACQEITELLNGFYSTVEKEVALWPVIVHLNPKAKFQALLAQQETVGLLAKFGHDIVTALFHCKFLHTADIGSLKHQIKSDDI
jgi:hypothetical protein